MTKSRGINAPKRPWTEGELATLRQLYPHQRTSEIAALLGIGLHLVYSRAARLGLKKGVEFFATSKSGRILKGGKLSQATQFRPGKKSWNTGTHFTAGGRSAQTRFKAGNLPHTHLPVGSYRLVTEKTGRQHLEQKTSETKGPNHMRWVPVTRLVWIHAHGPVPAGQIVVFKKGMHTIVLDEITADRLDCISLKENAWRNSIWHNDPDMAHLYQLKGQITRQVNRINQESRA
jgi:hypothetical protein